MQFELPQVVNAPWTTSTPPGGGPLPPLSVTVGGVLNSFRRRWWSVALGALVGLGALILGWFLVPPQIEVEAILELSRKPTEIGVDKHVAMQREEWEGYKATQAQLVKTRLALMNSLDSRDPETGRPVAELPIVRAEWDKIGWLQSKIRVWFPGDAAIMVISMKGEDPPQMVKLVNAITETYFKEFVQGEQNRARAEVAKLKAHLTLLQTQQLELRRRYESRALQLGAVDQNQMTYKHTAASANLTMLLNRQMQQHQKLIDKQVEIIDCEQRIALVKDREPSPHEIEEKLLQNQKYIDKIRSREGYQAQLREALATLHNPTAPIAKRIQSKLDTLDAEIDQLKDDLVPQIRRALEGDLSQGSQAALDSCKQQEALIKEELKVLDEQIKSSQAEVDGLHKSFSELDIMRTELESLQNQITAFQQKTRTEELNIEKDPGLSVYNKASVPDGSMDWMRYVMVAMLGGLGFCLPVLGLVAWDYQQRRLNASSDLPDALGLKLVGAIPSLSGTGKKSKKSAGAMIGGHNPLADAVDGVRTALMRDAAAESTRIVLVTSPVGREGKTTLATQLAASLGRAGRRTLLIDGDLRHPSAHRALGVAQEPGLAEILRSESEIEETIRPTRSNGLWVIPAGRYDEEALHALARDGVQEVFKELASGFDFVIIDAAPVLTDSDSLVIGQHVDAAILSVLRDISRVPQLFEARDRLRTVGVRLLGCVYHGAKGEQRTARTALVAK